MSTMLQVMLSLAALAVVVLVACLVPLVMQVRRELTAWTQLVGQMKTSLDAISQDSRVMLHSITELAQRANQQLDEVDQVVRTVRQWTARADQLVNTVGTAIEPPVYAFAQNLNLLRAGVTKFIQAFLHRNQD